MQLKSQLFNQHRAMVKSLLGYELIGHVLYNSYTKFMFVKVRLVFRNVIVFLLNTMMHSSNNTLL